MKKAFTLLELILMIVIGGMAIPPLVALLIYINKQSNVIVPLVKPNTFAVELMEEIKGKRWDENWVGGPLDNSRKTLPSLLGPDTGETSRNLYDDMDDYNALQNAVICDVNGTLLTDYKDYRVTVKVYYVPGLSQSPIDYVSHDTTSPPVSNSKRIDIILTRGTDQFNVSTIVTNY